MGVPMKFVIVCINVAYLVVGFKILAMERPLIAIFIVSMAHISVKDHQMRKVSI
jgi:hypothetical protein